MEFFPNHSIAQAWYMFDEVGLYSHCYARTSNRFSMQLHMWRNETGDRTPYKGVVPHGTNRNECFHGGDIGPFPLISGPFTAYSVALAQRLHALDALDPLLLEARLMS